MHNVEQRLEEEQRRMESITAPDDLEQRLRNALNPAAPVKRKKKLPRWSAAVVAVVILFVVSNNYNAFAYYGKKLLGYDEIMTGTLQKLNDAGMGQAIDRTTTLADGSTLVIEGIMSDENQLIVYYRLSNPAGVEDSGLMFNGSRVTGFWTDSNAENGTAILNEERTEEKGTMVYEPVNPFAKKLTLHLWQRVQNNQMSELKITFPYRPDQAMQTQIKQSIRHTVKVDNGSINFRSLTATPTMTLIKGTLNAGNIDRVNHALHGIELMANGKPIELLGSGNRSSLGKSSFELRYDALPEPLESLELTVKEFAGYQKLDEQLDLTAVNEEPVSISGRSLWVRNVTTTSAGTEITIATEEDVMLDDVSVKAGNELTGLQTTVNQLLEKLEDATIVKERTLIFDTSAEPEYLVIGGMHFMKEYNKTLEIPVR
ncbi:hypothetical protein C2I18_00845 [Paenibacillus sp. PK3_47]|uniref:DUF4179 domain-containing protein n=1 Tax=Paenibacillus sp. PK3_47 TaxID=2072642 RepID=UPI00201E6BE0|nr:DUF4179 domain-containing protein [Paenibacillus sp. PK3_47]UQZ32220.1 hypothetical protein C2I18_00845 [Paenibacillus sp. PK3_47]